MTISAENIMNLYKDEPSDLKIMSRFAGKTNQDIIDELKPKIIASCIERIFHDNNVKTDLVNISKDIRLVHLFKIKLTHYYNSCGSENHRTATSELIKQIEEYLK